MALFFCFLFFFNLIAVNDSVQTLFIQRRAVEATRGSLVNLAPPHHYPTRLTYFPPRRVFLFFFFFYDIEAVGLNTLAMNCSSISLCLSLRRHFHAVPEDSLWLQHHRSFPWRYAHQWSVLLLWFLLLVKCKVLLTFVVTISPVVRVLRL